MRELILFLAQYPLSFRRFLAFMTGLCICVLINTDTATQAEDSSGTATIAACTELLKTDLESDSSRDCVQNLAGLLRLLEPESADAGNIKKILDDLPRDKHNAYSLASLAFWELKNGEPARASELLLALILRYPTDPDIARYRIALARAFRESGDFLQSAAQLAPIIENQSSVTPWALLEQARLYHAQKDIDNASRVYQQIETIARDSESARIAAIERRSITLHQMAETPEE